MRKLSSNDIAELIRERSEGALVPELASKYKVKKVTIYYHIQKRSKVIRFHKKPMCYYHYYENNAYLLQQRLINGDYLPHQKKHIENELMTKRIWLYDNIHMLECLNDLNE